jgi:hypothetical protein
VIFAVKKPAGARQAQLFRRTLEWPQVADSVERLCSQAQARNATKTDLSDRPRIDDRDLGKG